MSERRRFYITELKRTDDGEPQTMGNIPIGAVAYASVGTSAVHVAGSLYVSEIYLPRTKRLTGIGVLNGAIVGTDSLIAALYSAKGLKLANSALAGALSAGANAFQQLAFTVPYEMMNDGTHYIVVQCNGGTATTRRIAASTYLNRASIIAGSFGTLPAAITVPSSITADAGPIAYVY